MNDLLTEVQKFIAERGISPTKFGREAVNDPNLVSELNHGREPRRRTVERVRSYIAAEREKQQ